LAVRAKLCLKLETALLLLQRISISDLYDKYAKCVCRINLSMAISGEIGPESGRRRVAPNINDQGDALAEIGDVARAGGGNGAVDDGCAR
jgi:hypothetical protein